MTDNKNTSVLTGREIAVIGMAGRFPGSRNLKQFWQNLRDGVEAVKFFSDEELLAAGEDPQILRDPHYVKAGSVLDEVEMFDERVWSAAQLVTKSAELKAPSGESIATRS